MKMNLLTKDWNLIIRIIEKQLADYPSEYTTVRSELESIKLKIKYTLDNQ